MRALSNWFNSCGLIAPFILVGCIIIGAIVTPGYNHVSDPISQLSAIGSPHPAWMITGFIAYGLLITFFGFGLSWNIRNHQSIWLVLFLFTLNGIGFFLGGIFRDDPRTLECISSSTGILHNIFIIIGCSSFVTGMFVFDLIIYKDPVWRRFAMWSIVTLVIILLAFTISQVPALVSIEGLMQRTYGILSLILIEATSIKLFILRTYRKK